MYFSSEELSRILERCTLVTDTYFPVPWLLTGRLHTRAASIITPVPSTYEREILKAPNGSTVAIDWFDHPEEVSKKFTGLLLIMNHACNGNTLHLTSAISNAGRYKLGCCLITLPGISDLVLSGPNPGFGLSFLVELQAIMDRVNQHVGVHFPKVSLAFSLGGVPLLEFSSVSPFFSQVYISLPLNLDLFESDICLEQAKRVTKKNSDTITKTNPTISEISNLKELRNLFPSSNPIISIESISRPTLLIYALDDESIPFFETVDLVRLCRNKNIAVATTNAGGHCGFQTVNDTDHETWIVTASLEFLASSILP